MVVTLWRTDEGRDERASLIRLKGASEMYGLIVKLMVVAGKRDDVVRMLRESAAGMPGCLSYVVAADSADEDAIWVTEVWDSVASHDASLSLPSVTNAIPHIKPLISNFTKIAVTTPVWGVGLQSTPVT